MLACKQFEVKKNPDIVYSCGDSFNDMKEIYENKSCISRTSKKHFCNLIANKKGEELNKLLAGIWIEVGWSNKYVIFYEILDHGQINSVDLQNVKGWRTMPISDWNTITRNSKFYPVSFKTSYYERKTILFALSF